MPLPTPTALRVSGFASCPCSSPLDPRAERFVDDSHRILVSSDTVDLQPYLETGQLPPAFERAGPRWQLGFDPSVITCGIITCGGLCPGLNNVIRSVVLTLTYAYGVHRILGFRYGYAGLASQSGYEPMVLTPEIVEDIHEQGGTLLGTSRGSRRQRYGGYAGAVERRLDSRGEIWQRVLESTGQPASMVRAHAAVG